jgi:putative membrane protein
MHRHVIALSAAAALIAVAGGCQKNRTTQSTARTYPSPEPGQLPAPAPDIAFMQNAAMSNRAEIELSDLAVHQSESEPVRRFARMMIDDHTAVGNEAQQLARAQNITLPTQPDTLHRTAAERLTTMRGPDFDREYLRLMVDDHLSTVAKFQHASTSAQDPKVRDFAGRWLPSLRQHLDMARRLSADTGMAPAGGATPGGNDMPTMTPMPTAPGDQPGATPGNQPGAEPGSPGGAPDPNAPTNPGVNPTSPATPGTTPTTPGNTPTTPGNTPTTPGNTPSTPGTSPTTPGSPPATPGTTPR